MSMYVSRGERGQKRAARLLANLSEARRRSVKARPYDPAMYDGHAEEDE